MDSLLVKLEQVAIGFGLLLQFLFYFLAIYLMRELPPFMVWKPEYGPGLLGVGFVSMAAWTLAGLISTYLFTRVYLIRGASALALLGSWVGIPGAHITAWIFVMLGIGLLTETKLLALQYFILISIVVLHFGSFGWNIYLFRNLGTGEKSLGSGSHEPPTT